MFKRQLGALFLVTCLILTTVPAALGGHNTQTITVSGDGSGNFICDGKDGLKVFDATNVYSVKLVKQLSGMEAFDVISANNKVLVIAADGLYQYDYTDTGNIKLLSKISIGK